MFFIKLVKKFFCYIMKKSFWRGVRVAYGADLESLCGVKPTVGSNPTLSELI